MTIGLVVTVPATATDLFETALGPFALAVSSAAAGAGMVRLSVYCAALPPADGLAAAVALAAAAAGIDEPRIDLSALPDTDWVGAAAMLRPAVRVGRFLVHGAHARAARRPGDLAIELEAGTAFGTGAHASTAGCLEALDRLVRRRRFRRALDMGAGSGVLALCLARAQPAAVIGCDIDSEAVRVARENARGNGLAARVRFRLADGFARRALAPGAPYDLVLANILLRTLMRMARPMRHRLAPDAIVVLSGLLSEQVRAALFAFRAAGLSLTRRIDRDGWSTLILARR
jgi:ribosomal protein L11 methyltransferase